MSHQPLQAQFDREAALDFRFDRRLYKAGTVISRDVLSIPGVSYARTGASDVQYLTGQLEERAAGEPEIVSGRGYLGYEARTSLIAQSIAKSPSWVTSVGTQEDVSPALNALGVFPGLRVASQGATWHRATGSNPTISPSTSYAIHVWYRAGTSGRARVEVRDSNGGNSATWTGPAGALAAQNVGAGVFTEVEQALLPDGETYEFKGIFTSDAAWNGGADGTGNLGVGPASAVVGEDVIALGCSWQAGAFLAEPIISDGIADTRNAGLLEMGLNLTSGEWRNAPLPGGGFLNPSNGFTIFLDLPSVPAFIQTRWLLSLNAGSTANEVSLGTYARTVRMQSTHNGVSQTDLFTGNSFVDGERLKIMLCCAENDVAVYLNGVEVLTDTAAAIPVLVDTLQFMQRISSDPGNTALARLTVWEGRKPKAEAEAYTA